MGFYLNIGFNPDAYGTMRLVIIIRPLIKMAEVSVYTSRVAILDIMDIVMTICRS